PRPALPARRGAARPRPPRPRRPAGPRPAPERHPGRARPRPRPPPRRARARARRVTPTGGALPAPPAARRAELEAARDAALLEAERLDVTLPGRVPPRGGVPPLPRVAAEVIDFFVGLGYRVFEGREVETDWYNFEALNFPPDHPARSMLDSLTLV